MKFSNTVNPKYLELIEMDTGESLVCSIKKHPIGLIGIYGTGIFVGLAVLFGAISSGFWIELQPDLATQFPIGLTLWIIGAIIFMIIIFFTYVAGYIYKNNIIIVTTDKVAQILYRNLVDRKISQLSLGDLQDVTVDQRGILARMFKYGTLVIETAGEQNNYNFTYTPLPYECANEIVAAREGSIRKYGN